MAEDDTGKGGGTDPTDVGVSLRGEHLRGATQPLERTERFDDRYLEVGHLGRGGMGEILLCTDLRIGRDVAMKVLRDKESAEGGVVWRRFMREARVQGQLEHPTVAPVYDVGLDPRRRVFFTMKRVRGTTLRRVLGALASGDAAAKQEHSRHKLLAAFVQVCLAVDFAHSRGVVHRDLKPANIMLGDFGEVYVLDWGVAKVFGFDDAPDDVAKRVSDSGEQPVLDYADPASTEHGTRLGTLGYMAPEQIEGAQTDGLCDVYSLGAILFEILAQGPLHPGDLDERTASTLAGVDARARLREKNPDVPPELVDIVARAVARDPKRRFPSPRDLSDALDRYLSGDRDVAQRRKLADEHARSAVKAAKQALGAPGVASDEARSNAMREVSRALALDPSNAEAMRAFVQLVTELPDEPPLEVAREVILENQRSRKVFARSMSIAALGWFSMLPVWLWLGVRDLPMTLATNLLWATAVLLQYGLARHPNPGFNVTLAPLVAWVAALACLSRATGPFVVVPALAGIVALGHAMHGSRKRRLFTTLVCTGAVLLPALLEWLGWIAPTTIFAGGTMTIVPRVLDFPDQAMRGTMLAANVLLIALPALFIGGFRDRAQKSLERQLMTAWHLRQFVPGAWNEAAPDTSRAPPSG
jgi:serine/threonine-protein kinase